jgi:hypothetical protein
VSADGYDTVITHIFEPGYRYLREDTVFGVKASLVGSFVKVEDPKEIARLGFVSASFFWRVDTDFVLAPSTGRAVLVHEV